MFKSAISNLIKSESLADSSVSWRSQLLNWVMADSESSTDAMDVDLRASDLSLSRTPVVAPHNNRRYPLSGVGVPRADMEESMDLSVRPRSRSSSESLGTQQQHHQRSRVRQRWPMEENNLGDPLLRDKPTSEDRLNRVHLNGHINGFSDSSHLDSTDSEMSEMPPLRLQREMPSLERKRHEVLMCRLKEELRNEEMKLVLLKKLRQSQSLKESLMGTPGGAGTGASVGVPGGTPNAASSVPGIQTVGGKMSLAGRLGQPAGYTPMARSSGKLLGSSSHQSLLMPPMHLGDISRSVERHHYLSHSNAQALLSGSRGSSSGGSISALSANLMLQQSIMRPSGLLSSRMPVTTPPNVVIGYHNLPGMQGNNSTNKQSTSSQNQVSVSQGTNCTSSPTPQSSGAMSQADRLEAHQTPAQRQAAAKLALRKQLEKTLLQIPPPKPPPPEMHFIPNANNQEFVYLLGLEVVVGFLVGDDQRKKPPPDPFDCVQCCTDFTPVWKWQETSSSSKRSRHHQHQPAVICESCVTTNIKKALKAEHTNRLKTAFVKALQQEQEIEQRMSQGTGSPPPLCTTPPVTTSGCTSIVPALQRASTPPTSHSPIPSSHSRSERGPAAAAAANAMAAAVANSAALLQMPKLSAAHQSLLQAQQLQQLAQSLPQHQPQPAHMLPFGPLLAAQAYSYGMMGKSSLSTSDLQRQYLLDMIPPRSMSQSSMNWKT